nr:response regulator transcription factor [Eubacterium sp.]
MAKILVVEDDRSISELVKRNLTLVGHECICCYDGLSGLETLQDTKVDLILLDVMLPGVNGFEFITRVPDTPIIFVTAKGELEDRLQGLSLGAEDYIVKPFEMLELIARINVVLRRSEKDEMVRIGEVNVDLKKRVVMREGEEIVLTPQEFSLLEVLVINKNIALSREKLLELAWGYDYVGDTKTVDVHIQKLRKKLGVDKEIRTITKLGYRLEI